MATTPSTSTPQPSHTGPAQSTPIQSSSPTMVPTNHPTMVPPPHTAGVPTPHLIVVPAPLTSTPQPSHIGPSPVVVHIASRPSSSSNPSSDLAPTTDAPDSATDDIDSPLHERSMIEPLIEGIYPIILKYKFVLHDLLFALSCF